MSEYAKAIGVLELVSADKKTTATNVGELREKNYANWKSFNDSQVAPLRIEQYIVYSALLNEQQDLYAKNTTLTDNQKVQLEMIERIVSDFHNKGYGSMRDYQTVDYKVKELRLYIQFVKYALTVACILILIMGLSMMGVFNPAMAGVVSAIISIVFISYVALAYSQIRNRRKYEWDKMYWKAPKGTRKGMT